MKKCLGEGTPAFSCWRNVPVQTQPQTDALAPRHYSGGAGSPCQVQHPHFTSKLTEAQRGEEARCQDHTAGDLKPRILKPGKRVGWTSDLAEPSWAKMGGEFNPALPCVCWPEQQTLARSGEWAFLFFASSALSAWHGAIPLMSLLGPSPAQGPSSPCPQPGLQV